MRIMERIQIDARCYKEQYEEVLKIPNVGDKWQLVTIRAQLRLQALNCFL